MSDLNNISGATIGRVYSNGSSTIYCYSEYGPTFGNGNGYDLHCPNSNNNWSCSQNIYNNVSLPSSFTVSDWENEGSQRGIEENTGKVDKNTTTITEFPKRILEPHEIEKTFRIMAFRKSERQIIGRYRKRSISRVFWTIMFMMVFLSLMGAGFSGRLENVSNWKRLVIATIILLIMNRGSLISENSSGFATTYKNQIILVSFGFLEALTLIIWAIIRFAYPRIIRDAYWLDTIWWWRIQKADIKDLEGEVVGCFRYFAWESYSFCFRHGYIVYVGEVDLNGLPHGHGEWIDDSFDGECLKGIWEHGVPVGPFQSRISGMGDAIHSVRVGFVKKMNTPWDEWRIFPRPYEKRLDMGVASVECSVSGKYLKYLPRSSLVISQIPLRNPSSNNDLAENSSRENTSNNFFLNNSLKHCLKNLITFSRVMENNLGMNEQTSITIRFEDDEFRITGYYPINGTTSKDEVVVKKVPQRKYSQPSEYVLEIEGWQPLGGTLSTSSSMNCEEVCKGSQECIIFIHGFNCPTKFAIETFGQFLALAYLPDYIKPFVFSPPGSNSFHYCGVKSQGCSEESINDFRSFLQNLRDTGFCAVHIISHSMGCMIALNYVKAFEGIIATIDNSKRDLKPENFYQSTDSSFPSSSKQRRNEKQNSSFITEMKLSSVNLLNPDTPFDSFINHDYSALSKYCDHITIYSNSQDFALKVGEFISKAKTLGRQINDIYYKGKLMNIDLIDTTQLDVNIHKIRHNFFNLNRLLVDDLCDIIIIGKRARERKSRLSRKVRGVGPEGVVYTFLVAPIYKWKVNPEKLQKYAKRSSKPSYQTYFCSAYTSKGYVIMASTFYADVAEDFKQLFETMEDPVGMLSISTHHEGLESLKEFCLETIGSDPDI
ncbi:1883_t:CDS:2, partial [Diversispora eburnea]